MTKGAEEFVSELSSPSERWLSRILVHALSEGYRTPEDFLEYFSANEIMQSLEADPDLRARILVEAAGVHERIARKKSTNSAAEDLRIALDEGICDAKTILELFPPDDRVSNLDHARLWSFLTEDEFWLSVSESDEAITRVSFMLEAGLNEELLTLQEITEGIGFEEIAKRLPREDLEALVVSALNMGRKSNAFDEAALVEAVPLASLLGHLSLERVWDSVVVEKLAKPAELLGGESAPKAQARPAAPKQEPASEARQRNRKRKKTVVGPATALKTQAAPVAATAPKPAAASAPPPPPARQDEDVDVDVEDMLASRSPQEEEARKRVTGKLRGIDRLPPKHESLPTGILLSMESMYAELFQLGTDEEREECIRDSFPNEAQLTTAMLALIELLDPSIDITDPVIRDADVASLIKVVLFEERHRAEQANPSRASASVPAPPGQSRRAPTPPPLPQTAKSTPPPLPPPARAPRAR